MSFCQTRSAGEFSLPQHAYSSKEEELQDLEDTYAECLADNVEAKTLAKIYLRIKALKTEAAMPLEAA